MISFPNAKINLGLNITEKRPDGFHNIETILIPVEWSDVLEILPGNKNNAETEFRSSGIRIFGSKEKNLCLRAYSLLKEKYSLPPVKIYLHKIIPVGAGLGGGSSDATSTLLLLNKIFSLHISENDLLNFASQLGSDCAFFLKKKPVFATGKGEILENVKIKSKPLFCVLVKPRIHISTALAYSLVKPKEFSQSLKEIVSLPLKEWRERIVNDFEEPLFEKYSAIKNIKNRMYKLGAIYASMTGSGSAVYGLFEEEKHLDTYFRSSTVWSGKIYFE